MCSRYIVELPFQLSSPPNNRPGPQSEPCPRHPSPSEAKCSAVHIVLLVVHGADGADQPVSSPAETLLSNRDDRTPLLNPACACLLACVFLRANILPIPVTRRHRTCCDMYVPPRSAGTVALTASVRSSLGVTVSSVRRPRSPD